MNAFTFSRLHKGAFGVGDKIARGERTDVYVELQQQQKIILKL